MVPNSKERRNCVPIKNESGKGSADSLQDQALILGLEPLNGIVLGNSLVSTNLALLTAPLRDASSRTLQHNIEVHTVNTGGGIVLQSKVNVLRHAKAKTARALANTTAAEVLRLQLEF